MKFFIIFLISLLSFANNANAADSFNPYDIINGKIQLVEIDSFPENKLTFKDDKADYDFGEDKQEQVKVKDNVVTVCNVKKVQEAQNIATRAFVSNNSQTNMKTAAKYDCQSGNDIEGCSYAVDTYSESVANAENVKVENNNDGCFVFTFGKGNKNTVFKETDQFSAYDKQNTDKNTSSILITVTNSTHAIKAYVDDVLYWVNNGRYIRINGPKKITVVLMDDEFEPKLLEIKVLNKPQIITRSVSMQPKKKEPVKIKNNFGFGYDRKDYVLKEGDTFIQEAFLTQFENKYHYDITKVKPEMTDAQMRKIMLTERQALADTNILGYVGRYINYSDPKNYDKACTAIFFKDSNCYKRNMIEVTLYTDILQNEEKWLRGGDPFHASGRWSDNVELQKKYMKEYLLTVSIYGKNEELMFDVYFQIIINPVNGMKSKLLTKSFVGLSIWEDKKNVKVYGLTNSMDKLYSQKIFEYNDKLKKEQQIGLSYFIATDPDAIITKVDYHMKRIED